MPLRHVLVGDDRDVAAGHQRGDARAGLGDQPRADHDVVAALAELDADASPRFTVAASLAKQRVERGDDLGDDRLMRPLARGDHDVGLSA